MRDEDFEHYFISKKKLRDTAQHFANENIQGVATIKQALAAGYQKGFSDLAHAMLATLRKYEDKTND